MKNKFENSVQLLASALKHLLSENQRLLILTGAGISTDSGIPDYRGPNGTYTRDANYKPITFNEFATNHERRKRYWARSMLGFNWISQAHPNDSHRVLANLQLRFPSLIPSGFLVTQNVDGLHYKAQQEVRDIDGVHVDGGNRLFPKVVEMHGSLLHVDCLVSRMTVVDRDTFQDILVQMNDHKWKLKLEEQLELVRKSTFGSIIDHTRRPDGDFALSDEDISFFRYPSCLDLQQNYSSSILLGCTADICSCQTPTNQISNKKPSAILKPNVVFFGENLRDQVKQETLKRVDESSAVLVIGTSLQTYSAYRLVKRASDSMKPIFILNTGPTRADNLPYSTSLRFSSSPFLSRLFDIMLY